MPQLSIKVVGVSLDHSVSLDHGVSAISNIFFNQVSHRSHNVHTANHHLRGKGERNEAQREQS